jgi:hypothetical protein
MVVFLLECLAGLDARVISPAHNSPLKPVKTIAWKSRSSCDGFENCGGSAHKSSSDRAHLQVIGLEPQLMHTRERFSDNETVMGLSDIWKIGLKRVANPR